MTKQRWLGLGLGVTVFLIAFGLALAQQLFQVSRQVPADLEVFDTTVLPDGQLVLEFRDGTPVDHIGLKRFNEGAAGTRRIFVTNETSLPISLFLSDPCHAAVDANTGQKIGHFDADLHAGAWWDGEAGMWNTDNLEWVGNTCDNERPPDSKLIPGQTYTMDIGLDLDKEFRDIEPSTIALEPVIIGGVGREVEPGELFCPLARLGHPDGPSILMVETSLHPNNSLIVDFAITADSPSRVYAEYESPGVGRFLSQTTETISTVHSLPVLRLRPLTTYCFQVFATDDQGRASDGVPGTFRTGPLPVGLQGASFTIQQGRPTYPLTLLEHNITATADIPEFHGIVALDSQAHVVWYYEEVEGRRIIPLVQSRANWHLLYHAAAAPGSIKEVTPLGQVVAASPDFAPCASPDPRPGAVHHEILAPVDGKVVYLGNIIQDPYGDQERLQVGDTIRQWDQVTGQDVELWDTFDFLDPLNDRTPSSNRGIRWTRCDGVPTIVEDWTHANSIQVVEPRGNIIMSMRHLDQVISIAPDFQSVEWRMGGSTGDFSFGDFTFLDPSDRFYHQHSARELPNGNILLFDNGNFRSGLTLNVPDPAGVSTLMGFDDAYFTGMVQAAGDDYSRALELAGC